MAEIEPKFYTVIGVEPEVLAYGMAKFSRSADTLIESLRQLSGEKAAKFFDTFYFQYGHASIADLLHIVLSLENIPLLHAIEVWDEALIDGQESSTRYQNFTKRRFATPAVLLGTGLEKPYQDMGNQLFETYLNLKDPVSRYLLEKNGPTRPPGIDDEKASRTANARTFDRTRYLLPSSTYTNMGVIMSARTAEKMIIRLVSSPHQELQTLGVNIREAIQDYSAFNLTAEKIQGLLDYDAKTQERVGELRDQVLDAALKDVKSAPTLVKYTAPSFYQQKLYLDLKEVARQHLDDVEPENGRGVRLHFGLDPEIEVAATALYKSSNHSFRQALYEVEDMSYGEIKDLINLLYKNRGLHDDPARETNTGRMFIFDIETDNGAFRDLIRHRNMVKIIQDFTPDLGYDVPEDIVLAGVGKEYRQVCDEAGDLARQIETQFPGIGQYILPLSYRRKILMKMDSRQLQYIIENRTTSEGHFSYRDTAYQMWEQAMKYVPDLAQHIRVTHPSVENFWKR